jgi:hypothetical protein
VSSKKIGIASCWNSRFNREQRAFIVFRMANLSCREQKIDSWIWYSRYITPRISQESFMIAVLTGKDQPRFSHRPSHWKKRSRHMPRKNSQAGLEHARILGREFRVALFKLAQRHQRSQSQPKFPFSCDCFTGFQWCLEMPPLFNGINPGKCLCPLPDAWSKTEYRYEYTCEHEYKYR